MSRSERLPRWIYRLFNLPTRLYHLGFGQKVGPPILILTTIGRKSGLPRQTPLQYEVIDGVYYCGSMRGARADWFRNILANPQVTLQVGPRTVAARAEPITNTEQVVAFLRHRLQRSPRMITAIMRADGFKGAINAANLQAYANDLAVVALRPLSQDNGR